MRFSKIGLLSFGLSCLGAVVAGPALANTIVVTQYNTDGWTFSNQDNAPFTNASGDYEFGPATPPLGNGSAQLTVGDSQSSEILYMAFSPVAASSLQTLNYWTYVTSSQFGSGSAPTLQFDLYTGTGTYEGRLVFDLGLLGNSVQHNVWQDWDASGNLSAWYFTHASVGSCSISGAYCTLSQALSQLNGIDIADVLFKAGSGQANFNGNVDDFDFNGTVYNFEDVPEPGTLGVLLGGLLITGLRRRRKS